MGLSFPTYYWSSPISLEEPQNHYNEELYPENKSNTLSTLLFKYLTHEKTYNGILPCYEVKIFVYIFGIL